MNQESSSKFSNLKKKANFSLKRSSPSRVKLETVGFKKKGFRGKLSRGEITTVRRKKNSTSNIDDELYEKRNNYNAGFRVSKRVEGDDRGRGLKSNYRDRKVGNKSSDFDRKSRDNNGEIRFRKDGGKGLFRGKRDDGRDEFVEGKQNVRNGSRVYEKRSSDSHSKYRMFDKRKSGDDGGGSRMFIKRESMNVGGDRRKSIENGEIRMFDKRESRDENRSGLLRKNGNGKFENGKHEHNLVEDREFGKKKFLKKKNFDDDSMASFDRPKRKMRLIRIGYQNDTANKRFDDSLPKIDNTIEKKEGSDTEEKAEMSQNAQFRAIQPSPSIISFVNENLLGRRREIEFRKAGYNIELPSPLDNIPFSTSSERERIEESVFRNKLDFFAAAKVSSSFPPPDLPEIAFAGRSNVGKSSLLNSLTRQWGVVRTSDKPGLTQTINFFNLGSKLCLIDLPGYGFAYAKEEVKESWEELVKDYVSTREGLKRVCLLIDTKWGMKPRDHELVDLMERSKTKYQIVLTKTDLDFPVNVARRAMQIEEVRITFIYLYLSNISLFEYVVELTHVI
ncbi:uncharacterized protein [Rutidosis leptorrhynchoides]|uniref:uncharacterized protein isoform X2 n=1 Tax=Rutidosis leptorrhynchoides TaxID=125765 RepID=UPI003A992E17